MIQINLLRISPDSLYLEFSVECPINYTFTKLYIKRYSTTEILPTIDASNLFESNPTATKHVMRIAVSALGGTGMFQVTFGITGATIVPDAIGICSDVNHVYSFLMDSILNMQVNCLSEEDYQLLTKNYLFLYAHMEAMRLERFDEAGMYYDILINNFANCDPGSESFGTRVVSNCGCR